MTMIDLTKYSNPLGYTEEDVGRVSAPERLRLYLAVYVCRAYATTHDWGVPHSGIAPCTPAGVFAALISDPSEDLWEVKAALQILNERTGPYKLTLEDDGLVLKEAA